MEDEANSISSCYILDASSLIEIEGPSGKGLKNMPEPPGKWLIIPSKVIKEVDSKSAPKETKDWINSGKATTFISDIENRLFMRIRVQENALSDPDIEGIVIAYHRKGIYVAEDGPAIIVAKKLGIKTMNTKQFLAIFRPRLFE